MSDYLAHRLAHQLLGRVERARGGVGRPGLDEKPVAVRPHVVVIPGDVALDDLTAARVRRAGADRVANQARRPAHDGVADVLRIPLRVLLWSRGILRDDGVLAARVLGRAV